MTLALGTQVEVHATLHRDRAAVTYVWHRTELPVPCRGIVVGYRNRHDGHMESDIDDWTGNPTREYVPTRGFQTILVATDLYRKHVIVLPDDVVVCESAAELVTVEVRVDAARLLDQLAHLNTPCR